MSHDNTNSNTIASKSLTITPRTHHRRSSFMGCFGISERKKAIDEVNTGGRRKGIWFSWLWDMRRKKMKMKMKMKMKKNRKRLGLIYENKVNPSHDKIHAAGVETAPERHVGVAGELPSYQNLLEYRPHKKKHKSAPSEIILDGRNDTPPETATSSRSPLLSCPIKRSGVSQITQSQEEMSSKLSRKSSELANSPLLSLPKRKKKPNNNKSSTSNNNNNNNEGSRMDVENCRGKSDDDPMFGLLVVTVILFVMLVWGKLCAIICTSLWFCFVSRLKRVGASSRVHHDRAGNGSRQVGAAEMDYEELKKKVVMEGFLDRNHHHHTLTGTSKGVG